MGIILPTHQNNANSTSRFNFVVNVLIMKAMCGELVIPRHRKIGLRQISYSSHNFRVQITIFISPQSTYEESLEYRFLIYIRRRTEKEGSEEFDISDVLH